MEKLTAFTASTRSCFWKFSLLNNKVEERSNSRVKFSATRTFEFVLGLGLEPIFWCIDFPEKLPSILGVDRTSRFVYG